MSKGDFDSILLKKREEDDDVDFDILSPQSSVLKSFSNAKKSL